MVATVDMNATGCVYEMFSNNKKCNKTYVGSTTGKPRGRLASHKYKKHPIFSFGEVDVRVLEKDIPVDDLRKREGEFIRERQGTLFNIRVAGRTQKERYHENIDASRAYQRSQYTPKKDGGADGYRQLNYYHDNARRILRRTCLQNAHKRGTPPTERSIKKYGFTAEELGELSKP
jgi:hypothetical protein